jgi:hypothetical protein
MEVQLKSTLETIDGINVTMEKKDEEIWIFVEQNKIMSNKKNEIQQQLYSLKESSKRSHFTFDDLNHGGALENLVWIFRYLPTVECFVSRSSELFRSMWCWWWRLVCQNLTRFSAISIESWKDFQAQRSGSNELASVDNDKEEKVSGNCLRKHVL